MKNKVQNIFRGWFINNIQKNVSNLPQSRKTIIFDLAWGWFMSGLSFGISCIMFIYSQDKITKFIGCPFVILWGVGFLIYGLIMANLYLGEFTKHRD